MSNVWFWPQALMPVTSITKTADQPKTSDAVMANDTELVIAVEANKTYDVLVRLIVQGATADSIIKVGWAYPAGSTITWTFDAIYDAVAGLVNSVYRYKLEETSTATGLCDSSQDAWYEMKGELSTSGTAGNLALMWAQSVSSVNTTKVLAKSRIRLTKTSG